MTARQDFLGDTRAATMVEYALLVGLIAIVSIAAITATGQSVRCIFEEVSLALSNVTGFETTPSGECGPDGVTQALADLDGRVTDLEGRQDADDFTNASQDALISDNTNGVLTNASDIAALQGNVSSQSSSISSLNSRVTAVESTSGSGLACYLPTQNQDVSHGIAAQNCNAKVSGNPFTEAECAVSVSGAVQLCIDGLVR